MHRLSIGTTQIIKRPNRNEGPQVDLLAVEEPLEIRIGYGDSIRKEVSLTVTMRSPGDDENLALGFLFTEGIVKKIDDIISIAHCQQVKEEEFGNVMRVELNPALTFDFSKLQRNFYTNSSCGVCGKSSIEAIHTQCSMLDDQLKINENLIHQAPEKLLKSQQIFGRTGGLHAAGLFSKSGELVSMTEDVGRHNALDKLIGCMLNNQLEAKNHFILVSSRASFELVQKAVMARIPVLAAVGAPSSLAVDLARESNLTLLGFVRNNGFNIYTREHRIQ